MKALILSCNTGQGHNSAGKAVMAEFLSRGIKCDMVDTLTFSSERISSIVSKIHSGCAIHAPKVYAMGYKAAEKINKGIQKHSPCYMANATYANDLYKYISEGNYDTIIMPHVFPAETMTRIKRKYDHKLHTFFISTDYAYPPFLKETEIDGYFIPHKDLIPEFTAHGMNKERLYPLGIPVSQDFTKKTDKLSARKKLGLHENSKIILVMTGSMGFGKNTKFIDSLLGNTPKNTLVIMMGGNNKKMKAELREKFKGNSRLTVLDFTTEVSLYMDAADILFTKPGGLSTTEAAAKGIPFVHSAPIPGWEESNVRFFKDHGMSLSGESPEELVTSALYLLGNPWKCEKMLDAQANEINCFAARDICEKIIELTK